MLLRIDFRGFGQVKSALARIGVTLFINWLVKPFSRRCSAGCLSAVIYLRRGCQPISLTAATAGLILLRRAPVRQWCLSGADHQRRPLFHAVAGGAERRYHDFRLCADCWAKLLACPQSSCRGPPVNPPWYCTSLCRLFCPALASLLRRQAVFDNALTKIGPWSMAALLATLVLLFAFQGEAILATAPLVIAPAGGANSDSGAA